MSAPYKSVGDLLDAHRRRTPQKAAIVDVERDAALDFAALADIVDALARQLQRRDVRSGSRVVIAGGEGIDKLLLWLALWHLGAVVCPIDVTFTGAMHTMHVFDLLMPDLVLLPADMDAALVPASAAPLIRFGTWPPDDDNAGAQLHFRADLADRSDPLPRVGTPGRADTLASMCCTSGTTGLPKVVVYDHASYWYNGLDSIELLALTPDDRTLEYRSFDWYSAQILSLMPFLQLGSTLCIARHFSRSRFAEWIARHRVTVSAGIPTVINMLLEAPIDVSRGELATLRAMTCSTAPLSNVQWSRFEAKYGIRVLNLYGSSETGWICGNHFDRRKFGTVGFPPAHIALSIVDPNGSPCAVGETGQVVVDGEKLAIGLLTAQHVIAPIRGAPFATRDIATRDDDGFVVVSGRMDDLIIRGGVKIQPNEIEDVLLAYPGVREVAAIGVPDPIYGHEPVCFVVPRDERAATVVGAERAALAMELTKWCCAYLPQEKQPKLIQLTPALPRNERGKVMRDTLRREWWMLTHAVQQQTPR
ncbi:MULTISPECIES: class I adenylate-forming enzyme family protein [unclassified Burkholderia]|uniref:class I adenylate-forming enzyme family protein n=1 Tax=unclassified Burkholderia TaxID=2613784 RepID=UPI002AAF25FA|nr:MULTISPECIES: class I adenylate-forming enzyme family protein [unclassified Burkholderia]